MKLPRWFENLLCVATGAAFTMALTTFVNGPSNPDVAVEAFAWGFYGLCCVMPIATSHDLERSPHIGDFWVKGTTMLLALASMASGFAIYFHAYAFWGVGMMVGTMILIPTMDSAFAH